MQEHKEERDERYKSNQMKLLKLKKPEIRNLLNEVSVQFTRLVVSNSLRPHWLQRTRPPCPSPTPRAYSNSRPLSRWCHPTITESVMPSNHPTLCSPLLLPPSIFPSIRVFSNDQFFASGGQSIGTSVYGSIHCKYTV